MAMDSLKETSAASVLPDCRHKTCIRVSTATRGLSANGFRKNNHCMYIATAFTCAVLYQNRVIYLIRKAIMHCFNFLFVLS